MTHMTASSYKTGTYDMHFMLSEPDEDGDFLITIFALPEVGLGGGDAPILAQVDVFLAEVGQDRDALPEWMNRSEMPVGLEGLEPEWFELVYGRAMARRMNEALVAAIEADAYGVDMDRKRWREPSWDAVADILKRARTCHVSLLSRGF
jgi:hypothetical protein